MAGARSYLRETDVFFEALDFLHRVRPFDLLPAEDLLAVVLNAELQDFPAGSAVVAPADTASLIWEGEVEVPDQAPTMTRGYGEWVLESGGPEPRGPQACPRARRPTRVLLIPHAAMARLADRHPSLASYFTELLLKQRSDRPW